MSKKDLFSEVFNKHDKSVVIDRKEENDLIKRFQETGDMSILEQVYIKRIPTLKNWALKFYYPGLELSIDDFMEELSIVFIKAAQKFNVEKGSFNTCLYTYLNNRIKNMKNSTHAKKRRPENFEGPISGILLSLDHSYTNERDGNQTTLKSILTKETSGASEVADATHFQETVKMLSNGNDLLQSVFIRLGQGSTLSSIIRDFKTVKGDIKLTDVELVSLEKDNYTSLKDIIVKKSNLKDTNFVVVDYDLIGEGQVYYSIEFKETEEAKLIQKTIKDLRKNKDRYIKKIREE